MLRKAPYPLIAKNIVNAPAGIAIVYNPAVNGNITSFLFDYVVLIANFKNSFLSSKGKNPPQ